MPKEPTPLQKTIEAFEKRLPAGSVGTTSRAYSLTHFTDGPNAGGRKDNLNIPKNKKAPLNPDGTRMTPIQIAAKIKRNRNRKVI